jgi:UDP-GlcNAc3NAcA epimerase
VELVEHKFNVLVGADKISTLDAYSEFRFTNGFSLELYCAGNAAEFLVEKLCNYES